MHLQLDVEQYSSGTGGAAHGCDGAPVSGSKSGLLAVRAGFNTRWAGEKTPLTHLAAHGPYRGRELLRKAEEILSSSSPH